MIHEVVISRSAKKDLETVPAPIRDKLITWVMLVRERGLETMRRIPGYHDEPLHGKRKGQRSIRLNLAYRAIYVLRDDGTTEFVSVEEVNKHEY